MNIHWGTDAEAETPILWPPDAKNWLIGKDPDAGKDWRQEEKGITEDEMVGWHHWLDGHEFEQTPGVSDGQESLVYCSPWAAKSQTGLSNWTDWLTDTIYGLPWWLTGKESACSIGDSGNTGSVPGMGRSPGEGNDNPLQYSCLGNLMDRGD